MEANELTISQVRKALKEKKFSVTELVSSCFERIKRADLKIKAFVTVTEEESLKEAKEKDNQGYQKDQPLWGIPFAVKDNFLTKGVRTTASSKVLADYIPPYDATVIKRLKEAGVIIIGKTNMDAWAHGSSTETSQFFTTKNPWDLTRLPGGSSGGSAAAVAADMCIAAIGSETAGSIRQPSSWCGVVGFKPSYGVVSRYGVIAMASSLDCPGPITKTVIDAKIIFETLCGRDPYDATTVNFQPKPMLNLSKLKIGIPREYFPLETDNEVKTIVLQAVETFKNLGMKLEEISLIDPHYAIADYTIQQRAEVSSNLARYDGIRYGNDRSFFGEEAKRRIMLGTYTLSAGYYDAYYLKGQKVRSLICQNFEKIFEDTDLLIAPTSPSTALPIGSTKDQMMFGETQDMLVEASSLAGLPGISLNCGFSKEGLPVGMQIIGPRFSEDLILSLAKKYESLTENLKIKPKL